MKINTVDTVIQDFRDGQNIFRRPSVELMVREISRLQQRVQELEQEKAGILSVLGEVVNEAYLQDPFGDDAGMNLLHGASLLLNKMLPHPPQEEK